jgi:hypothetical protein
VIAIAAGEYSSFALTANGTVLAWGANVFGQLQVLVAFLVVLWPNMVGSERCWSVVSQGTGSGHPCASSLRTLVSLWGGAESKFVMPLQDPKLPYYYYYYYYCCCCWIGRLEHALAQFH